MNRRSIMRCVPAVVASLVTRGAEARCAATRPRLSLLQSTLGPNDAVFVRGDSEAGVYVGTGRPRFPEFVHLDPERGRAFRLDRLALSPTLSAYVGKRSFGVGIQYRVPELNGAELVVEQRPQPSILAPPFIAAIDLPFRRIGRWLFPRVHIAFATELPAGTAAVVLSTDCTRWATPAAAGDRMAEIRAMRRCRCFWPGIRPLPEGPVDAQVQLSNAAGQLSPPSDVRLVPYIDDPRRQAEGPTG